MSDLSGKAIGESRVSWFVVVLAIILGLGAPVPIAVGGYISLEWRPPTQTVSVGDPVNIALYAVSSEPTSLRFSSLQAIFNWDPSRLMLLGRDDTGRPSLWMYGFLADPYGLNEAAVPADGDGLYVAIASLGHSVTVTSTGTLLTTFLFKAVAPASQTTLSIVPSGGSPTGESFVTDEDGYRVTGGLGEATVTILPEPATLGLLAASVVAWRRRRYG
jgi:hypothetical protein